MPHTALLLLLAACGYKQEDFSLDYAQAWCQLAEDCELLGVADGYADLAECEDARVVEATEDGGECPEYDRKAAVECVDAVNQMTCEELYDHSYPQACTTACLGE